MAECAVVWLLGFLFSHVQSRADGHETSLFISLDIFAALVFPAVIYSQISQQ